MSGDATGLYQMEEIDWKRLTELVDEDIEWRVQKAGKGKRGIWAMIVPYGDARKIAARLDEVVGPLNWHQVFKASPNGEGNLCALAIRHPRTGEWIYKQDGAEDTQVEATKGGLTDAFKRAAILWNITGLRSLYRIGTIFARNIYDGRDSGGAFDGQFKDGNQYVHFTFDPPPLSEVLANKRGGGSSTPSNSSGGSGGASSAAPSASAPSKPSSEPAPSTSAPPPEEPPSKKQVELIGKMAQSHVITDEERAGIKGRLGRENTKKAASEIIEWLMAEVPARKAAEKEQEGQDEAEEDPILQQAKDALDLEPTEE